MYKKFTTNKITGKLRQQSNILILEIIKSQNALTLGFYVLNIIAKLVVTFFPKLVSCVKNSFSNYSLLFKLLILLFCKNEF
jgi:hypothetical protein